MKKNYSISLIRFISMLLIICCHTCEWIGFTLGESDGVGIFGNYCAVGVQIFLLISGYLYGSRKDLFEYKNRCEFVLCNWWKILKSYYIYVFLFIFPVYLFLSPDSINNVSIWGVLTCSSVIGGVHHLWFIPYILLAYVITPALYDYKKYVIEKRKGIIHILFALCLLLTVAEVISIAYSTYFTAAWENCFIVGFFLPDFIEKLQTKSKLCFVIGTLFLSLVLNYIKLNVRYKLLQIYTVGIKNALCNYYINYSRVIFAIAIFCLLMFMTKKIDWPVKVKRILDISDKYSYDVYIVHMIYVKGCLSVLKLTNNYYINVAIMLVLTAVSAAILNYFEGISKTRMFNENKQLLHWFMKK